MNNYAGFFKKFTLLFLLLGYQGEAAANVYVGVGYGGIESDFYQWTGDERNLNVQLGYPIAPGFSIETQYSKTVSGGDYKFSYGVGGYHFWNLLVDRNPGMTYEQAEELYPYPNGYGDINRESNYETMALYGVSKTSGDLYVKAKAGVASVKQTYTYGPLNYEGYIVDADGSVIYGELTPDDEEFENYMGDVDSYSYRDTGFSLGVGAGYKFTPALFAEIEFTRLNEHNEYYSLTMNYSF